MTTSTRSPIARANGPHTRVRRAKARGQAHHGWLRSQHTFSFAGYFDPRFMGFGPLRVINQDLVDPGAGFPTHPHRDMEIITYVVRGALEHKDTMGHGSIIRPGEVQLMSAGTGVAHSEYNHSRTEPVEFLQIWLVPDGRGHTPRYEQKAFDLAQRGLTRVVSPDADDGALNIRQSAEIYRLLQSEGEVIPFTPSHENVWIQVIHGELEVAGERLHPGDGLAVVEASPLECVARGEVEALIFDLGT